MKAVVIEEFGQDYKIIQKDRPKPGTVPGHEVAGIVCEIGSKVPSSLFKIGDRVAAVGNRDLPFETCQDCANGNPVTCGFFTMNGITHDGGLAEYCLVDRRVVAQVPKSIPLEIASPLTCAGLTVLAGLQRLQQLNIKAGACVALVGLGALGQIAIQFAKEMGYVVVGIDARDEPIELAKSYGKFGPDHTLNSLRDEDPTKSLPQGLRVDAVVLLTGNNKAVPYASKVLSMNGIFLVIGFCTDGITFYPEQLNFKYHMITGTRMGSREHLEECFRLVQKGNVKIPMTYYDGLDKINELVAALKDPKSKGKFGIRVKPESEVKV